MAPPMSRLARLSALLGFSASLTGHALRTSQSAASDALKAASRNLDTYTFHDFVAEFSRTYEEGTEQWAMRKQLFTERLKDMVEFNSKPGRSWQKGVTKFMDYTEPEKKRVLGYTGRGSRHHFSAPANAVSLASGRAVDLPSEFSVERPGTKLVSIVREQGDCGSCWAEAATAALEGQLEANATLMAALGRMQHAKSVSGVPDVPTLSSQMIVSCTPNPRKCGGTGGCGGATVELAYEMIKNNAGLPFAMEWNYESGATGQTPACKNDLFPKAQVAITGYTILPSNRRLPLQEALVKSGGPIAISVDATNWFSYVGGIFSDKDSGQGDFTVNHAVTLLGYKEPLEDVRGYWVIKNSWGPYWGESGKIRLEMKEHEESHCGWDYKTHAGVACEGDPDQAWVCGTCGILYDSVYPTGVHLKTA